MIHNSSRTEQSHLRWSAERSAPQLADLVEEPTEDANMPDRKTIAVFPGIPFSGELVKISHFTFGGDESRERRVSFRFHDRR